MPAYSVDLRQRVLRACDRGMAAAEVAAQFDVSVAWVSPGAAPTGKLARLSHGNKRSFAAVRCRATRRRAGRVDHGPARRHAGGVTTRRCRPARR